MVRSPRVVLLAATVLVLALLSLAPIAAAQTADVEFTDEHVFTFGKIPKDFASSVEAAGGSVVRVHPEIGVAVASGLSDEAAASIAQGGKVARDVLLQWSPDPGSFEVQSLDESAAGASHDPTAAFFFPFQWDMQIINADDAWNAGFQGDPAVRVAVIDSGIDPYHADLAGLVDHAASIAFTPSLSPIFYGDPSIPDWADDRFHGTHVAGSIVTNGIGTSGVAPHTTLIAIKALDVNGSGSFADIIAGLVHAAAVDADVINMSLGVPGGVPKNLPGAGLLNAALNNAVNYANRHGILVVSAAGNDGIDMQHSGNAMFVPCESGTGFCVSATDFFDRLSDFGGGTGSNYGTSAIDVASPGGGIATGSNVTDFVLSPCSSVSVFLPIVAGFSCTTLDYLFAFGTSMAAPHFSGAAALLDAQYGGGLNAAQLETALEQTATDLGKVGTDPEYGRGRIDVCELVGCN